MSPLCTFPSCLCRSRCHWVGKNSWSVWNGRRCPYCDCIMHTEHTNPRRRPTVDHVIPLSKLGPKGKSNTAHVCSGCNSDKADVLIEDWAENLKWAGDPRANFVAKFIAERYPNKITEAA